MRIAFVAAFALVFTSLQSCTTRQEKESRCESNASCGSCLDAGCNWTADACHAECLMDTSCVGTGNPAAPTCPAGGTTVTPIGEAMGTFQHQCEREAEGFDCGGCQVVQSIPFEGGMVAPACQKDGASCPIACCNLCPKE